MQVKYISEKDKPKPNIKPFLAWLLRTIIACVAYAATFDGCVRVTLKQFGDYRIGGEILIPPLMFVITYYLVKEVQEYVRHNRAKRKSIS